MSAQLGMCTNGKYFCFDSEKACKALVMNPLGDGFKSITNPLGASCDLYCGNGRCGPQLMITSYFFPDGLTGAASVSVSASISNTSSAPKLLSSSKFCGLHDTVTCACPSFASCPPQTDDLNISGARCLTEPNRMDL